MRDIFYNLVWLLEEKSGQVLELKVSTNLLKFKDHQVREVLSLLIEYHFSNFINAILLNLENEWKNTSIIQRAPVLRKKIHKGNQMENDLSGQKWQKTWEPKKERTCRNWAIICPDIS